MPNPNGTNQFDRFANTAKHGDAQKLARATQAAPLSGAPFSALNAPRRNQRHATGQDRPEGEAQAEGPALRELQGMELPATPEVPDTRQAEATAVAWEQAAALPGASRLVRQYAEEARAAVGRNT